MSWRRWFFLASCLVLLVVGASNARAQGADRLSGVALIDYRDKPRFKVGDWVKYRFTSKSVEGTELDDYELTVLISGEERFWGDDCFWVETWATGKKMGGRASAVLMSYAIFGDTAWMPRLQVYHRKFADMDPDHGVFQELVKRTMKFKSVSGPRSSLTMLTDTLGMDTTTVPKGSYRVQKVQRQQGLGRAEEKPDSTERTEDWDRWTLYLTRQIPITSLAKETHEKWRTRKAWMPGQSSQAIQHEVFRGTGSLELIGFGSGDLVPRVTPEYARGPLKGKKLPVRGRRRG